MNEKDTNFDLLANTIRLRELERIKAVAALQTLTPQERMVAVLVWQAFTDFQIEKWMGISRRTVRFHLTNILCKLGKTSRVELAVSFEKALHSDSGKITPFDMPS